LSLLTFVIVGGGPTGVEYAGALAELMYGPIVKDYPQIDSKEISIIILEGMPKLLGSMPEKICNYTKTRLETMGVRIRLNAKVTSIDQDQVMLQDGTSIASQTVVWTAGVKGLAAAAQWGMQLSRDGRIMVRPSLQVEGHDNIYAAGDLAAFLQEGRPLPTIAPVAVQEGRAAARNIIRQIQGLPLIPFVYKDRGAMVTIGRNAAVAYVGGRAFTGFIAWLLWLAVHIFNLIGVPNRLVVMLEWAMDYFLMERVVRLILPGEKNCIGPEGSDGSACNL
jgi:NADH dehydrogenase